MIFRRELGGRVSLRRDFRLLKSSYHFVLPREGYVDDSSIAVVLWVLSASGALLDLVLGAKLLDG